MEFPEDEREKYFSICNESSFSVWDDDLQKFGNCFSVAVFGFIPALTFAAVSAYFLAKPTPHIRLPDFPWQIWIKITSNFLLVLLLSVHLLTFYLPVSSLHFPPYPALLICYITWIISEAVHLVFLYQFMVPYKLFFRRGPSWIIMAWLLTIPFYVVQLYNLFNSQGPSSIRFDFDVGFWSSCLALKLLYFVAHCVPNKPEFVRLPFRYQRAIRRAGRMSDAEDDDQTSSENEFTDRSLLLGESLTASYRTSMRRRNLSPEEGISLWSLLTFSWPKKLLRQGTRYGIATTDQSMTLPRDLKVMYCCNAFGVNDLVRPVTLYTRDSSTTQLDQAGLNDLKRIWKKMLSAYGFKMFILGIFQLISVAANFCKPLILSQLLGYMESDRTDPSEGFTWAGMMILVSLIEGLISVHLDYQLQRLKLSMRSVLVSSVYEKCTLVARHNFGEKSLGEILTLMSTDCDRLAGSITNLHQLWAVPLQCIAVLVLLYFQIGYIFFIGLCFSLVMIFVNHAIGRFIGKVNRKFMAAKDMRVRLLSDLIYSVRLVKMQSWENIFRRKVGELRSEEVRQLSKVKYLDAACVYFWATTPVLLSVILFGIFAYTGEALTAAKVFTSLSLINMLIFPLNAYPWVINGTMEGWVSLGRLQKLIDLAVIDYQSVYQSFDTEESAETTPEQSSMYGLVNNSHVPSVMKIENASFTWSDRFRPCLKNLTMKIGRSDFVGIVGPVGSGKTSLLLGLLGEMERSDGSIWMNDNHDGIAVVTQEPWIFNGTIRENILFGAFYNPEWYRKVVEACALVTDIENWPAGDLTLVGEGGSTLSGGQKTRINLARQVYQQKDIYFLDDPFAQLDRPVCLHIYENCIMGLLRDATKVLISHQVQYLRDARVAYVLREGEIVNAGIPSELLGTEIDPPGAMTNLEKSELECHPEIRPVEEEEEREEGSVSLAVYAKYGNAVGTLLSVCIVMSLVLMQGSKSITDWWLTYWIHHDNSSAQYSSAPFYENHREQFRRELGGVSPSDFGLSFLQVYLILGGVNSLLTLVRAFTFAKGGLNASTNLHASMLASVLRVHPSWFDKNPPGRVINRFSSDINDADDSLPFILNIFLNDVVQLVGTVAVITYALPWFLLIIVPLLPFYSSLQNYYRFTARDLKRLAATSLSPIYQHFSETITGAVTIRALRKQQQESLKNARLLEANQRVQFSILASNCWLNFRLTVGIGVTVIGVTTLIAVVQHEYAHVDPALVGLALAYAMPLTGILSAVMRDFLSTELGFISVERISQFSNLPKEGKDKKYPRISSWPSQGALELLKIILKYDGAKEPALNGISFKVNAKEHVAIVGRTGSGKTSIFNVLLGMVENICGTVRIDNVDTSKLDILNVRRKITSISQDPFLFSGTVRGNLDPDEKHDDTAISRAIEQVDLEEKVAFLGGLDGTITERGANLSAGQKQLFCLARAILNKSKLVLIDEATSHVDVSTDQKIQEIIKTSLSDSTVLSIQHRLQNVQFFDRVLVMDRGNIVQYDSPSKLAEDHEGLFAQMNKGNH